MSECRQVHHAYSNLFWLPPACWNPSTHTECQFYRDSPVNVSAITPDTPEKLCKCDCTLYPSTREHGTLPHSQTKFRSLSLYVYVFWAGTLLIGAQTWTGCSTSMQATGQCSSSGSWTEKRAPGTTSPSSPQSSVSEAGREAELFFVLPLPVILLAKLDFWNVYQPLNVVLKWQKGVL